MHPNQLIPPNSRQKYRPENPIHRSSQQNPNPNHAVQKIRQMLIHILTSRRRHERCNDEIDVRDEEEYHDGESSAEGGRPLLRVAVEGEGVEIEVNQAEGHEHVDDC